jgi:hypothetical protein
MIIAITKPLFAWAALEDFPSLKSIRVLLKAIPRPRSRNGAECAKSTMPSSLTFRGEPLITKVSPTSVGCSFGHFKR